MKTNGNDDLNELSDSDDFQNNRIDSSDKETFIETKSLQKGRFTIETTSNNLVSNSSSFKKGRFIVQSVEGEKIEINEFNECVEILNLYNQQMEILFDMIKNLAGEEKLFQKEFIELSNKVYEKLELLRKSILKKETSES